MKLKNISIKNFMSVGAVTQNLSLDEHGLTLVLGDNIDEGSNGNRNGVGKTVLIHAISFALFGVPMTKIKVDNLVNKTNNKNMLVTLEFEKNGHNYKIERGRKPNIFKFFIDGVNLDGDTQEDIAQGDSRDSNKEIERINGISHQLFKHIVALSTKTVPFLSEGATKQREIIEELLGITQLSLKADILKENIRETKVEIDREEMRHKMIIENNEKTKRTIDQLSIKSNGWDTKHEETSTKLENQIKKIMEINIDKEIQKHKDLEQRRIILEEDNKAIRALEDEKRAFNDKKRELEEVVAEAKREYKKELDNKETHERGKTQYIEQLKTQKENYERLLEHLCPTCGQEVHDDKHNDMVKQSEQAITQTEKDIRDCEEIIDELNNIVIDNEKTYNDCVETLGALVFESNLSPIKQTSIQPKIITHYNTIHEAYEHKSNLDNLIKMFEKEVMAENPYVDQIETVKENNLQEINYTLMNEFVNLLNHQEFLYKLLTRKDSVIRIQIIEQNLSFLNHRLVFYINQLGLPHQVVFLGDLSVDITKNGQYFDFDNLSTGESTRLVLALSWAFRDMYEALNSPINLMFIDELIDSGMDSSGGECALAVLKHMTRSDNKNIFLISHKDEFVARVSNVLIVEKENNFTNYRYDTDLQI